MSEDNVFHADFRDDGHGRVRPRKGGARENCDGLMFCSACREELEHFGQRVLAPHIRTPQ